MSVSMVEVIENCLSHILNTKLLEIIPLKFNNYNMVETSKKGYSFICYIILNAPLSPTFADFV